MIPIKLISSSDIIQSDIDICYFGWTKVELDKCIADFKQNCHSIFYGSINDALFECIDERGIIYYAVFKGSENDDAIKQNDYVVFKDNNRVLLNINGTIYRFLINQGKSPQNETFYREIPVNSYLFRSLSSDLYEVMIVADDEIIAALKWEGVMWKHYLDYATALELIEIQNDRVITEIETHGGLTRLNNDLLESSCINRIFFNVKTGAYDIAN